MESEKKRFKMISTGTAAEAMDPELDPFIQHGHLVELTGNRQKAARVMVNGSEMPTVNSDGQLLRYCNAALAAGRSRDYGHGAERCAEAAEKDCDSVRKRASEEASPTRDDCGRNTACRRRLAGIPRRGKSTRLRMTNTRNSQGKQG